MTDNRTKLIEVEIAVGLSEDGKYVAFGTNCMTGGTGQMLINDTLKGKCDDLVYLKALLAHTIDEGTDVINLEEVK